MKMVCIRLPLAPFVLASVILFDPPTSHSRQRPWASDLQVSEQSLLLFTEAAGPRRSAFELKYQVPVDSAVRRRLLPPAPATEEREPLLRSSREDVSPPRLQATEETPRERERISRRGDVLPSAVAASDDSESSETAREHEAGAPGGEREVEDSATLTAEEEGREQSEAEVEPAAEGNRGGEESSESTVPLGRPPGGAGDGAREGNDRGAATAESAERATVSGAEEIPSPEGAAGGEEEDEESDEEEAEAEGIDFQLHLPQQLRKVIPGTNIDYYDYVILEERLARGETDDPPDVRGGLLPDAPEKTTPQVTLRNEVFAYCYTVETEDLLSRCVDAANLGEGVYIPMVNMTDFGRHDDHEQGNPSLQVVSLSRSHYTDTVSSFPPAWFEAVRQLKDTTHLAVGGIWFGPPDFKKMDAILREHPKVFDGILVDWDSGKGACMNELTTPPPFNPRGQHTVWWKPKEFFMRYYVGGQDKEICRLKDERPYTLEPFISSNEREIDVPFGWNMTFPCFGGYEGRCYKAFSSHPDEACSDAQRYVFAPYDRASESMKIFLNDTCAGLGKVMPPYDIVLAV